MSVVDTFAWQKALVTALRNKATLTALFASLRPTATDSGIYDAVPQGVPLPYIVVGEGTETDAASFGEDGVELLADVEIWTADGESTTATSGAAGYRVADSIKAIVRDVLLNDTITPSGCTAAVLSVDTSLKQRDEADAPATRAIVLQARVLLEAT
jgi:hypothetical protein